MTTGVVDIFLTYQFLKRLVVPFTKWPAYERGIIDANGKVLKKRKTLTTKADKDAWRLFDVMTANLKKLLETLPGGRSRIATYAAALWLIKEHQNFNDDNVHLVEYYFQHWYKDNKVLIEANMEEDAPTNSAGSGNVAGMTGSDLKLQTADLKGYKRRNKNKQDEIQQLMTMLRRDSNA